MMEKMQILMAGVAALSLCALMPLPAFATDDAHPSLLTDLMRWDLPRLEPRLAPDPQKVQIADSVQSTGSSSSSSVSASSAASSSSSSSGGKNKCRAEASAQANANGVEDSDHDLKVTEADGCSARAESSAIVKPQKQQSE